jgi:mannose-6-phosphate isomerase-like protein (cupin superfamily)
MEDYTVKKLEDMEAVYGGAFKRARAELGVSSFGIQVMDLPPNFDQYPEHDHTDDDQEEVYLVLQGSAEIEVEGERISLDPETIIRVGPGAKRKIRTGSEEARVLALGATPGKVYESPDFTELGAPDPLDQGT